MAYTFHLNAIASDLSLGGVFTHVLGEEPSGTASITAGSGNGVERGFLVTDSGLPGTGGETGNYTVVLNVSSASSGTQARTRLHRLNAAGAIQTSATFTAYQSTATTGDKTFSFTALNLGTWAAGHRLALEIEVQNTNAHGSASGPTFDYAAENTRVDTPFTLAQQHDPLNATAENYELVGADADVELDPWVVITTLGSSAASHSDTTAEQEVAYDYRIKAENASGFSLSNIVTETPGAGGGETFELYAEAAVHVV